MAERTATGSGPVRQSSAQTDDVEQAKNDLASMRRYFADQDKEKIRVPEDRGQQFVQINGYTFEIAPGVEVIVPTQVAQMLRDSRVI